MAFVDINISGSITSPNIYIKESSEPDGSQNRYISGTIPGTVQFLAISDNQPHTYIVVVTDGSCSQSGTFSFTQSCSSIPTATFSTNCDTYNSTNGTVKITITPTFNTSTQVRIIINDGSTTVINQLVNAGVATEFTVPANKSLTINIQNPTYPTCALIQSYVAACTIDCNFSFNLGTNTCGTVGVTITDSNPTPYTISVKIQGDSTERFVSYNNGIITFNAVSDGTNKTYVVSISKNGCTAITKTFQRTCGGCDMSGFSLYKFNYSNTNITSMTQACSVWCNNGIDGGIAGYINTLNIGGFAYTSDYNCTPIGVRYWYIYDFNTNVFLGVIKVDSSGQIVESQPPCTCGNPTLEATINPGNPICSNGSLSGGTINITNASTANRYSYNEGSSYTGNNDCNAATVLTGGTATINLTGLQQGVNKTYTVRIWNTANGCTVNRDYTVNITVPICCVTYDINTNSNSSTTVNYIDCSGNNQSEVVTGSNVHKYVCAKSGSVTATGSATISVYNANACNPPSQGCSLTFQRNPFSCVGSSPKVQYLLFGGVSSSDYQFQIGNGSWTDATANIAEYTGSDGASVTINFRLKSNNSCLKSDSFTFTTNCGGSSCSKPSVSAQLIGFRSGGSAYTSPVDACSDGCSGSPTYQNKYSANLNVGSTVYNTGNDSQSDCSVLGDGWYLTSSVVIRIQGGVIVETAPHCFCGEVPVLNPTSITIPSGTDPNTDYTINVAYSCTTTGIKVYKNGSFWKQFGTGTHSFTFKANEVNDGDYITAKTNCGTLESGESNRTTISKPGTSNPDPVCTLGSYNQNGGRPTVILPVNPQPATFSGNVYWMFDSGGVPDKIIVKKNGNVYLAPQPRSYRISGWVPVVPGDVVTFEINTVNPTADANTYWTFYSNCTTQYDMTQPQPDFPYSNNDFPFILSVDSSCNAGVATFTVNAAPAPNGGYAVTGYKVMKSSLSFGGSAAGGSIGTPTSTGTGTGKWYNTNVLTKDVEGNPIVAGQSYVVFVKDNRDLSYPLTDKLRGLGEVFHPGC